MENKYNEITEQFLKERKSGISGSFNNSGSLDWTATIKKPSSYNSEDSVAVRYRTDTTKLKYTVAVQSGSVQRTKLYEPATEGSKSLKIPANVGLSCSIKRQKYIVNKLNEWGYHFTREKEDAVKQDFEGWWIAAYDSKHKLILITCDVWNYLMGSYFQSECKYFDKEWTIVVWVGVSECIFVIV